MAECLTAVLGREMLNFWQEKGNMVRMVIPQLPKGTLTSRREMARKLTGENSGLKLGPRFPNFYGTPATGITFNVVDHDEAGKWTGPGIRWCGKSYKVSIWKKEQQTQKMGNWKAPTTTGKKEPPKGPSKVTGRFSYIQCFACKGWGHKKENCNPKTREGAKKIAGVKRQEGQVGDSGNKKSKVDKEGF
jgi:hypothetical protein